MPFLVGSVELAAAVAAIAVSVGLGHGILLSASLFGFTGATGATANPNLPYYPYYLSGVLILVTVGVYAKKRLRFVGKDEQLYMEGLTELQIFKGPCTVFMPLLMKNWRQKRALTLNKTE